MIFQNKTEPGIPDVRIITARFNLAKETSEADLPSISEADVDDDDDEIEEEMYHTDYKYQSHSSDDVVIIGYYMTPDHQSSNEYGSGFFTFFLKIRLEYVIDYV